MKTETYYLFDLIESKSPKFQGKYITFEPNVGGIKNTYNIYRVTKFYIFKRICFKKKFLLGTQTFLCPYKKIWNKRYHRVSNVYWGKHEHLTRLWVLLTSNYNTLSNKRIILPNGTTETFYVEVYGIRFRSTTLSKLLRKNQSFIIT